MERSASGPTPTFHQAHEEHLLLQQNASAAGTHYTTFVRLNVFIHMLSQNVLIDTMLLFDVSFLPRCLWSAAGCHTDQLWQALLEKRNLRRPPWQLLSWRLAWKDMLLPLALVLLRLIAQRSDFHSVSCRVQITVTYECEFQKLLSTH